MTLQNADRKATYVASQQPFLCDYDLDAMWYRFEGAAGTKMPTTCVGPSSCGATRRTVLIPLLKTAESTGKFASGVGTNVVNIQSRLW